jgi:hypothetical protein
MLSLKAWLQSVLDQRAANGLTRLGDVSAVKLKSEEHQAHPRTDALIDLNISLKL